MLASNSNGNVPAGSRRLQSQTPVVVSAYGTTTYTPEKRTKNKKVGMPLALADIPAETNCPNLADPYVAWIVGVVKPREEKDVAAKLQTNDTDSHGNKGNASARSNGILDHCPKIVYFLPYTKAPGGRSFVALFPGYIFVGQKHGYTVPSRKRPGIPDTKEAVYALRKTRKRLDHLPVADQVGLRRILTALAQGQRPRLESKLPSKGATVQVLYPHELRGQTGTVDTAEPERIYIDIRVLGLAVSYPIPTDQYRVVE